LTNLTISPFSKDAKVPLFNHPSIFFFLFFKYENHGSDMCYVQFKIDIIDFELSLTSLGVKFKIVNFELHITHMLISFMIFYIIIFNKIKKSIFIISISKIS
jgi:hypothetical protein